MTLHSWYVLLLAIAAVCFALAAVSIKVEVGHEKPRTINLVALGLLAWVLVNLIVTIRA